MRRHRIIPPLELSGFPVPKAGIPILALRLFFFLPLTFLHLSSRHYTYIKDVYILDGIAHRSRPEMPQRCVSLLWEVGAPPHATTVGLALQGLLLKAPAIVACAGESFIDQ